MKRLNLGAGALCALLISLHASGCGADIPEPERLVVEVNDLPQAVPLSTLQVHTFDEQAGDGIGYEAWPYGEVAKADANRWVLDFTDFVSDRPGREIEVVMLAPGVNGRIRGVVRATLDAGLRGLVELQLLEVPEICDQDADGLLDCSQSLCCESEGEIAILNDLCPSVPFGGDDDEGCAQASDQCAGLTWKGLAVGETCTPGVPCSPGTVVCWSENGELQAICDSLKLKSQAGGPGIESCNGVDDDCDDLIDESEADLGQGCGAEGGCSAGVWECRPGGKTCSTHPGGSADMSGDEICDSMDNDCDGTTDEGCTEAECSDESGCDDQDACTQDSCVDGTCSNAPIEGCGEPECSDDGGCDDQDACTQDSCVDGTCVNAPIEGCGEPECSDDGGCDDQDACTQDSCVDGACAHTPLKEGEVCGQDQVCDDKQQCIEVTCEKGQPFCDNHIAKTCNAIGTGTTTVTNCGALGMTCADGVCVCTPSCDGASCGDDGCGGSCGSCSGLEECNANGLCQAYMCPDAEDPDVTVLAALETLPQAYLMGGVIMGVGLNNDVLYLFYDQGPMDSATGIHAFDLLTDEHVGFYPYAPVFPDADGLFLISLSIDKEAQALVAIVESFTEGSDNVMTVLSAFDISADSLELKREVDLDELSTCAGCSALVGPGDTFMSIESAEGHTGIGIHDSTGFDVKYLVFSTADLIDGSKTWQQDDSGWDFSQVPALRVDAGSDIGHCAFDALTLTCIADDAFGGKQLATWSLEDMTESGIPGVSWAASGQATSVWLSMGDDTMGLKVRDGRAVLYGSHALKYFTWTGSAWEYHKEAYATMGPNESAVLYAYLDSESVADADRSVYSVGMSFDMDGMGGMGGENMPWLIERWALGDDSPLAGQFYPTPQSIEAPDFFPGDPLQPGAMDGETGEVSTKIVLTPEFVASPWLEVAEFPTSASGGPPQMTSVELEYPLGSARGISATSSVAYAALGVAGGIHVELGIPPMALGTYFSGVDIRDLALVENVAIGGTTKTLVLVTGPLGLKAAALDDNGAPESTMWELPSIDGERIEVAFPHIYVTQANGDVAVITLNETDAANGATQTTLGPSDIGSTLHSQGRLFLVTKDGGLLLYDAGGWGDNAASATVPKAVGFGAGPVEGEIYGLSVLESENDQPDYLLIAAGPSGLQRGEIMKNGSVSPGLSPLETVWAPQGGPWNVVAVLTQGSNIYGVTELQESDGTFRVSHLMQSKNGLVSEGWSQEVTGSFVDLATSGELVMTLTAAGELRILSQECP